MGRTRKKIPKKVQNYFCSVISSIKSQTPRFIHGCKRPKSLPSSTCGHRIRRLHQKHDVAEFDLVSSSATLDDIDRYLFENFRSLYGMEEEAPELDDARSSLEIHLPAVIDLRGSNRFFITPVCSGSLIEEARSKSDNSGSKTFNFGGLRFDLDGCVPVVTVSVSPYDDFLRSMADVVSNAGLKQGRGVDWEFMEELLFSYLRLNDKEHYSYVLKAFVDLVADSRRRSGVAYCE